MRILLLTPSLNSGGVETGTIDLAKSFKKLGNEIVVVSSGGQLVKELEVEHIKHIQLPIHKKSFVGLFQIPRLIKIIKEESIDIVHTQSRMPAWIAYFACKKARIPFVTSCHGYYSKHFFSKVMGWGRKVIVISKIIARHMQDNFGVVKEKICLVYRGVDLEKYQFKPDKYNISKDKFIITNIARITPIKGQKEFIKAINLVVKEMPNIEVWLVGSADRKKKHYEKELHGLVKELRLEEKVKFLGNRENIPEILRESDLLVLSTRVPEAFGRVIIEAGASGTAVCAPNIGGISEIIQDNKDGFLFSCGNIDSMAQTMITVLKNRDLMAKCSQNLRRKIQDNFSLGQMVNGTLEVYRQAIEQKRILVIKLGGLGDVILSIPSLRMLRIKFPQHKISLLMDKDFEPVVENCPYIDDVILFDHYEDSFFKLRDILKQKEFDLSIDLKNNYFTHLLAYLSRIPLRYGFAKGSMSFLLNYRQDLNPDLAEGPMKQQFRILRQIGVTDFDDSLELWTNKKDENFINGVLNDSGVFPIDKLVGLVLGASSKWSTKNWPIKNFYKLSVKLIQHNIKVILIGESYLRNESESFPDDKKIINFVGKTNLSQLVSLIKRINVLITPDSAPMHIAAALNTKIIALFGPTDPNKHMPPAKDMDILVRDKDCQPCYKRKCVNTERLICLKEIGVDEVFDIIIKKLS